MTAIESSLPSVRAHKPRPLIVILGGDDASRLAAVAALPLGDAIIIGHQGTISADLGRRARRLEDIAIDPHVSPVSCGSLHAELLQTSVGAAFAVVLQERREHLLLLDLNRPSGLVNAEGSSDFPLQTDNVAILLAAVDTLLRLISESGQHLRIDTLNRECPISLALGCGMVEPQALQKDAGVSVVLVPLIPRDCDAAVANFHLWNDPQSFPRDSRGPSSTDLVFVFNCAPDPQLQSRLEEAFSASPAAGRCFRRLRIAFLGLEGEDDRYIRRASGPMPRYGYKAGPNLLFFGAIAQLKKWGYAGFAALMEVDCRPLRRGWLDALDRLARRHPDAWVVGSIYRGHGILGSSIKRHLNGNALYAVGSPGFHEFLEKGYLSWLQAQITQREADLAFDTAWDRFLESADPERANTAEWRVAQHVLPRFVTCDEIVNIAGDPEIRGQIAFSRETLRRSFPATYLVHGPIASEDRNLDVSTLSEALSRLALDNAIGNAAQGLIIEEWLAAPGLSRRGAESWSFVAPGPETAGGILLGVPDGLMEQGVTLVAHVAVRADRRTMLRFSLAPGTEAWHASSRDIFMQPSITKRFRVELALANPARYVAFRVSSAPNDSASALTINFDELRFERLDVNGQHEGGLSLGLTSLEAANYGALSMIGSTPVPPEGGASPVPNAATPPASDAGLLEWVPRLHLAEPDDADLRTLLIDAAEGDLKLARLKVENGKLIRLILWSPTGEASVEIPPPQSADDLVTALETDFPDTQRTTIETLAIHWQQLGALIAGDPSQDEDSISPDAAAALKADPSGFVAAIDTFWHRPQGRRHIDQILSAVLSDESSGPVPFSGLFRSLQRLITDDDPEAAWRVALAAIEGRTISLPRNTAVAVAEVIQDSGRLQAFANHMSAQGEHEAAAEICRISVAQGQAPRDAYLVLANSEAAQGRSAAAGVALRLGVGRYPSDRTLTMELVKWFGAQGLVERAADVAWQLAQTRPEHPDVVAEIAARLAMAGRHDDVISFGEEYISDDPDLRLALSMLDAASQTGRHAEALRLARLAVKLGAPDVHVAGPVISAAARLWEVEGAAEFAEELLTRQAGTLLPSLLDARLRVFERQRAEEAIDVVGLAGLVDWIDARHAQFPRDLKTRAMELAASCGLRDAVMRGIRHWRVRPAPHDAAAIARALLSSCGTANLPASDDDLVNLLVSRAEKAAEDHCNLLLAVEITPSSPALQLAAQLVGLQVRDAELVKRHGLLQPRGPFDRPLRLWPPRVGKDHWPYTSMNTTGENEAEQVGRQLGQAPDDIDWPTIIVVLPSLNQAATIEESVLSILNQGYPNVDVVVVDGGSVDGTLDVLARYAEKIRTIVRHGMSQSEALTVGFEGTEADLLCWLNTDDLFLPGALFAVAGLWLASRVDVIVGDCLHFRDDSIVDLVSADRKRPPLDLAHLLDIEQNWLKGRYLTQPEVFFSRTAYERAGAYIDKTLNYALDYDLWLRMALAGAQSIALPRPLAAFRRHEAQKTARQFDAFTELVTVRNRHLSAPPRIARRDKPVIGSLALCPWDAPPGSPLAALVGAGKPILLPAAGPDAEGAVILSPLLAHQHDGPVLDIIGLGGPLPEDTSVSQQLRLRKHETAAWIWTPEMNFVEKLRLSSLFDQVVPTNAATGAFLHNLDAQLQEIPECSALNPLRQATNAKQRGAATSLRWLHLSHQATDSFAPFLPPNARFMLLSAFYSIAQGDGGTARELLASYDVVSMTGPGMAVPGLAYDTAALGCRTLVVAAAATANRVSFDNGIYLTGLPQSEDEAAELIARVKGSTSPTKKLAKHDLVACAAIFLKTRG